MFKKKIKSGENARLPVFLVLYRGFHELSCPKSWTAIKWTLSWSGHSRPSACDVCCVPSCPQWCFLPMLLKFMRVSCMLGAVCVYTACIHVCVCTHAYVCGLEATGGWWGEGKMNKIQSFKEFIIRMLKQDRTDTKWIHNPTHWWLNGFQRTVRVQRQSHITPIPNRRPFLLLFTSIHQC